MTTSLRNVQFSKEILSFLPANKPVPPLQLMYAMADLLSVNGNSWLSTYEAKSLLHSLNIAIHGANYSVDSSMEQQFLERRFK
jgi:hypothetical protein